MHQYECQACEKICEIEEIEAVLHSHDHEHYEHGQCQECFNKSLNEEELDDILIHKERGE